MDLPHNISSLLKIHINNIFFKKYKKSKKIKKRELGEELIDIPPHGAKKLSTNGRATHGMT